MGPNLPGFHEAPRFVLIWIVVHRRHALQHGANGDDGEDAIGVSEVSELGDLGGVPRPHLDGLVLGLQSLQQARSQQPR